jgi:hypothetical protein
MYTEIFLEVFVMKNRVFLLYAAIGVIAVLTACGSTGKTETQVSQSTKTEEDSIIGASDDLTIDWRGRNVGVQIPKWVVDVGVNELRAKKAISQEIGKEKVFILRETGANPQILESALSTRAAAQIAQQIRAAAAREGKAALEGELSTEAASMVNQFDSLYAKATITGLENSMNFWVKTRSKSKGTEKYEFYAVWAISQDDLNASIAETFGKVAATTRQQQDMKRKLEDQMKQLMESVDF